MLKVGLVDDHIAVAEGFKRLIELDEEIQVSAIFDQYETAIKDCPDSGVDVLVVDIALRNKSGIELIRSLKCSDPDIKCIALSMYDKEPYITEAIKAGAYAYVSKRSAPDQIVKAIHAAHKEEFFISNDVKDNYQRIADEGGERTLSEREIEILRLLAQGLETKEIAYKLDIATKTAHAHKANIFMKLALRTRKEVLQFALLKNYITVDDILND